MKKASVLVTGASGFVGQWLVRRLVQEGHQVKALVRSPQDQDHSAKEGAVAVLGDVTDLASLQTHFAGLDSVFHLAGCISYRRVDRPLMEKVNVEGTQNVIAACRSAGVRRLVHMSSVVAVGALENPNSHPLTEDSEYNLHAYDLGYFETKLAAEKLVLAACAAGQLSGVILNPSTIYGAGDAEKGSRSNQIKVAQGRMKLYPPGGVNIVAVEDVIDGTLAAWQAPVSGRRYILSGENMTLHQTFQIIAEIAGSKPPQIPITKSLLLAYGALEDWRARQGQPSKFSRDNARAAVLYHWFDSFRAQRELQFKPRPAREALAASVNWMQAQGLLQK